MAAHDWISEDPELEAMLPWEAVAEGTMGVVPESSNLLTPLQNWALNSTPLLLS